MASTEILFLGTDSVTPTAGEDTASFLLNRRILVDTGWCAPLRMQEYGVAPESLTHLLFTHLHHDHYLALPALIFHRWMLGRRSGEAPLTIVGPAEDLALVVQLAKDFLQVERYEHRPVLELRPLEPGESYTGDGFELATVGSVHPVQGLCYRFTDLASGAQIAFSGDTAYLPALAELARGADLLVHEASHGAEAMAERANTYGHSGSPDAARIAAAAGVKRLALVHGPVGARPAALEAARAIFPATFWPATGERLTLPEA